MNPNAHRSGPRLQVPALAGWRIARIGVSGASFPMRAALERIGAVAIALPTLSLRAAPPATVKAALADAAPVAAWIFTSPAAVRFGWRGGIGAVVIGSAAVFAIGPGTAAVLQRHGVGSLHPTAQHDADGVLAMPELLAIGGTVAIVNAPGGRTTLLEGLRARGMRVATIAVYERACARWDRRHHERLGALLAARGQAMLVATSGAALECLIELAADSADPVRRTPLVVSSERLAARARELGFHDVRIAAGVATDALLAAMLPIAAESAA